MSKQIWFHLWYSGLAVFCVLGISKAIELAGESICNAISKASGTSNRTAEQTMAKIEQGVSKFTAELQNVDLQRVKFQRFLQYEISNRFGEARRNFQLLKGLNLGSFRSIVEMRKALSDGGVKVNEFMEKIFDDIQLNPEEVRIALMTATVEELGFLEGATYRDVVNKISQLGFSLCPAEVGPQLRLQYDEQPRHEELFIATKVDDYADDYLLMVLERGDKNLSLRAVSAKFFNPDDRLVFIKK